MRLKHLFSFVPLLLCANAFSQQDKLFFNRAHFFEHEDCQHPIGMVLNNKVYYSNNSNTNAFMHFNNLEDEIVYVNLINFGKYTIFDLELMKSQIVNKALFKLNTSEYPPSIDASLKEVERKFELKQVKDSIVDDKTLKHIRIIPKDTLVHRFESYNLLINASIDTETPLYSAPEAFFLLKKNLPDMTGTVVETFFIDLQGNRFCRDVLSGYEATNKRVIVKRLYSLFEYEF